MLLHNSVLGTGSNTIVLLHGMAGSSRYWQPFIESIDLKETTVIAIDLLGFGLSPKPKNLVYDYTTHLQSIDETLQALKVTSPVTVIGHSMGALLALRWAALHPHRIKQIILCGLPFYPSLEIARRDITQSKLVWQLAYYGPTSKALCTLWCKYLRPFSKHIAPLYLPHLPADIAADTLLHSWQAYSQSLENIIEKQNIPTDLQEVKVPTILLYGASDKCGEYFQEAKLIDNLKNVKLEVYPNLTHQLPLEKPSLIVSFL